MNVVAVGSQSCEPAYVNTVEALPGEAHTDVVMQGALDGVVQGRWESLQVVYGL
jgi:hypothetical protein